MITFKLEDGTKVSVDPTSIKRVLEADKNTCTLRLDNGECFQIQGEFEDVMRGIRYAKETA